MAACGGGKPKELKVEEEENKEKPKAAAKPPGSPRKTQSVEIAISGSDLPDLDEDEDGNLTGAAKKDQSSDPFVVVYEWVRIKDSNDKHWVERGRTETIQDDKDPKWKTTLKLKYKSDKEQICRIDVYDSDDPSPDLSLHDYMGSALFALAELVHHGAQQLRAQIKNQAGKNPMNETTKQYSSVMFKIANDNPIGAGEKPTQRTKWPDWEIPKKRVKQSKLKDSEQKEDDVEYTQHEAQKIQSKAPEYLQFWRKCPYCGTTNEYWIVKPDMTRTFKMHLNCGSKQSRGGCKQTAFHEINPQQPGQAPKNAVEDDREVKMVPA